MKDKIHPGYKDVEVTCNCGNSFITRSTIAKKQLSIEVCSMCHPFYTGLQKMVDSGGRVDKFKQRYTQKAEVEKAATPHSEAKVAEKAKKKEKVQAGKAKTKTSRKIKVVTKPKVKKEKSEAKETKATKAAAKPKAKAPAKKAASKKKE